MHKRKDRLETLEIVIDALIGVLVKKQIISREDIQKHILVHAQLDKPETKD